MPQPPKGGTLPAAVDLDVLRDATGGDRDLMQELARLYLSDADLQLRALEDALQNRELDRLRRIGSALSAGSEAVGADVAAQIFTDLEVAAKAGDPDAVRVAIDRGLAEFVRVRKALRDLR